jgi:hypothetical protein
MNKIKIQSRVRVSTRDRNNGWMRTGSDIELNGGESFGSETYITSTKDKHAVDN